MAEIGEHPVDRARGSRGAERKLRSTERSRKSRWIASASRANQARAHVEARRIGTLEAEDRLLEVADGEDGAAAERAPSPAKNSKASARDDVPLPFVGVLRLVDEDVVGLLVELVAHPVADAGRQQQALRPGG